MQRKTALLFLAAFLSFSRCVAAADSPVTSSNDSGPGSLAQAISDANALAGADRVTFNIPGPGVHKIEVGTTALPVITDTLVIDGYTQPGASPNTVTVGNNTQILIQIDGGNDAANDRDGIVIKAPDCVIRGLAITGFVQGSGPGSCDPCGEVPVGGHAIWLKGVNCSVAGNFIGVLPNGSTMRGSASGVTVAKNGSAIGGVTPEARNVISGNITGITLSAVATVSGNYIGTNASGTASVKNFTGVSCHATVPGAVVGGTTEGAGNLISGNGSGVVCGGVKSQRDLFIVVPGNGLAIKGNTFGLRVDGAAPLSNYVAIEIAAGSDNTIGGSEPGAANLITGNTNAVLIGGVLPSVSGNSGSRNRVLSNRSMRTMALRSTSTTMVPRRTMPVTLMTDSITYKIARQSSRRRFRTAAPCLPVR